MGVYALDIVGIQGPWEWIWIYSRVYIQGYILQDISYRIYNIGFII